MRTAALGTKAGPSSRDEGRNRCPPFYRADDYDQVSVPVLWPNASVSTPIFCSRVT